MSKRRTKITTACLESLKKHAAKQPLRRSRYLLHASPKEAVQEMVIAFCQGSYVRPHRHLGRIRKSYHVIEGDLMFMCFDARGCVTRKMRLGAKKGSYLICRYEPKCWHTVYALSRYAIIHEVIEGPYHKAELAPWSPDYGDELGILRFLKRIRVA